MEQINAIVSHHWCIPSEFHGLRADQYLKRRIGRISRKRAQGIIGAGDFLLDDKETKASCRVKSGQKATLRRFAPDLNTDIDDFIIEKIFENDDILVINKPPGLSIHPSANCLYKTLTYWLRKHYPQTKINPCHRIDKETSGIVICAKSRTCERAIKKAFMQGLVKKTYLAIVNGILDRPVIISIPLGLQKEKGLVAIRMVADANGQAAVTKCRPLRTDRIKQRTLLLCHPLTGRQHQIRAHLSLIGHALVGDKLYAHGDEFFDRLTKGDDTGLVELAHPRHALHAAKVRFCLGDESFVFKCPLPKDLLSLIEKP